MAYYDYDNRYNQSSRRPDSYYSRSYAADGYPRHAASSSPSFSTATVPLTAMFSSPKVSGYSSSYDQRYAAAPPPLPKRSSAQSSHRPSRRYSHRRSRWPPSPTCEDEVAALAKEYVSGDGSVGQRQSADDGEAKSRGTVDQYPILEEIEQPSVTNDERRFVLVSDPSDSEDAQRSPRTRRKSASRTGAASSSRRKSVAERGGMPHLNTDINHNDPPVFTERTSTPYASSKPQRESIHPSAGEYFLSPDSVPPSQNSIPRSVPTQDSWDSQRDQNSRPSKNVPIHSRYDSLTQPPPRSPKNDVFEDSDLDEDPALLRTERKPARYSFVKSDLQKEDLRTNLMESQSNVEKKRSDASRGTYDNSSGSSKNPTPGSQSPRSSNSSLNGYPSRPRPVPIETGHPKHPRTYSDSRPARPTSPLRPSSPLSRESPPSPSRSPQLPPRRPADASSPRPPSRSGAPRPPSPLSFSTTMPPTVPITEADWHATYPPMSATESTRPPSRLSRYETMPPLTPRIDVHSPSPARPPPPPRQPQQPESPLPYPVDDMQFDAFMPPVQAYQYDHSNPPTSPYPSVNRTFPDSPKLSSSPITSSPRERQSPTFTRPLASSRHTTAPEEIPRMQRVRSNSMRSSSSHDGRRPERTERRTASLDRRLPTCPRSTASSKYDDWYTLDGCSRFDICPECYNGAFKDTEFASYFQPVRRYDARFCDFSSPWMRLAWLLTIKQRRPQPDLLYSLSVITDLNLPCPNEHEAPGVEWYGIADPRDGIYVANFRVCPCDLKMIESLFPSIQGYMTRLPPTSQPATTRPTLCSLRVSSKRFPKYLDLLVELDEEARLRPRGTPDINRFITLARTNAFRDECPRDQPVPRKAWHFIPSLPELTVCAECYDDIIYPAIQARTPLSKLFNRNMQLVHGEDSAGSTCGLYSARMRRIFARADEEGDFSYLKRKVLDRKRAEVRLGREREDIKRWMESLNTKGMFRDSEYERARRGLRSVEEEWGRYE